MEIVNCRNWNKKDKEEYLKALRRSYGVKMFGAILFGVILLVLVILQGLEIFGVI